LIIAASTAGSTRDIQKPSCYNFQNLFSLFPPWVRQDEPMETTIDSWKICSLWFLVNQTWLSTVICESYSRSTSRYQEETRPQLRPGITKPRHCWSLDSCWRLCLDLVLIDSPSWLNLASANDQTNDGGSRKPQTEYGMRKITKEQNIY